MVTVGQHSRGNHTQRLTRVVLLLRSQGFLVVLIYIISAFSFFHLGRQSNLDECISIFTESNTNAAVRTRTTDEIIEYKPASTEFYVMKNADKLGFDRVRVNPVTCSMWQDPTVTTPENHANLVAYISELEAYQQAVKNFKPIPNLMSSIKNTNGKHEICDATKLHPDGITGFFSRNQLSLTASGYVEPLLPPQRHPNLCGSEEYIMSMDYLVHDFEAMCHKLKPTSKLVLIDIGASLDFHGKDQPIIWLMNVYEKMGFHFDHIYGFEPAYTDPKSVYEDLLPEKYFPSYHWINVGVSPEKGDKLNPLNSILKQFDEDDFIVLKLDIDEASIELQLVLELLEDKRYSKLVDQFYFEHHVHMKELEAHWHMKGSVKYSLEIFSQLREKGIPAHFWP